MTNYSSYAKAGAWSVDYGEACLYTGWVDESFYDYYFDEFYDDFDTIRKDKEFTGSSSISASKTKGTVLFNGDLEGGTELGFFRHNKNISSDVEIYGGVYVNKNVYIEVCSVNGSKRDKEKAAAFLKELGFPKP